MVEHRVYGQTDLTDLGGGDGIGNAGRDGDVASAER